jgi:hypothetical protein
VHFDVPNLNLSNLEKIQNFVRTANFPFHTFEKTDSFYNGKSHGSIHKVDYDPIPITFNLDTENHVKRFFIEWSKLIMDENRNFGYKDDYVGRITIILLDRNGNEKAEAVLEDAYPLNIDPVSLSYDENDSINQATISFSFSSIVYNLK